MEETAWRIPKRDKKTREAFPAGQKSWGWEGGNDKTATERRLHKCKHLSQYLHLLGPKPKLTHPSEFHIWFACFLAWYYISLTTSYQNYLFNQSRELCFLKIYSVFSSETHFQTTCFSLAGINGSVFTAQHQT